MDPHLITGDMFLQWSIQETSDLLMIKAELDSTFMETKGNKLLWEVISAKMKERGYDRSAEQCESMWKNLVTRYKETEEEGTRQQFPFYNDMQAIFSNRMQRVLWKEASGSRKKQGDDEILELDKFMKQQMQSEMQLMKMYEAKEEERRMKEMEWRKTMEELEKQRLMFDEQWREREDQRRMREEARAERRDALITALLNKLTSQQQNKS